eukprot:TRINITY_DN4299_c0_g1_i1.p1 TRINITY_DN4299_c0_g1~~TRINITY_DN4299_c0_g1_i1.p1  ORF type:complete len:113 (-),score=15.69 TRINITY_DN4299_c0_g1_i1:7-345(-)
MEKAITNNVEVTVETWYHEQASSPGEANFVHAYEVTITNRGDDMVQLISREWHIKDTVGAVSYTHLRAHETVLDLVCRLLLEKKKKTRTKREHKLLQDINYVFLYILENILG